ncbi:LPS export ABC transporter ATP-binding protein [Croceicoccus marinus]|uniref:LPS export ABC transporter ATP-binding protein n=1 Tax=Croceicoccus marinus TaxID=450378 RepID=UPI001E5DAB4B|nr:LPS export ABC transporter ATP-binding protein [Croceicoccus marinus]
MQLPCQSVHYGRQRGFNRRAKMVLRGHDAAPGTGHARQQRHFSAGACIIDTQTTLDPSIDPAETAAPPVPQGGLEVVSIAKSYDKRTVLSDISLTVAKGEVLGLLGPNGAGKTTCFYSVMGLVKPDSGRILLDGEDITNLPMYRRAILGLGYLPQETSIFRGMTVEQNISCVLELSEPDAASRARELERLLDEFGLTRLRESPAMALSGGERRRCEIARALAAKPSIMLLDEPFAGIDPLSISDIRDLVIDLRNRGIGVLITDHNVRETLEIVDRAAIIYGGQVLFAGSPEDLVANDEVRRLYLGEGFTL